MGRHVLCGFYRMDGLLRLFNASRLLLASLVLLGCTKELLPAAGRILGRILPRHLALLPIALGLPACDPFLQPAFRWRLLCFGAWVAASVAFEA